MSIGDIHSDAPGSGARYNDGKARLEYIPARILYDMHSAEDYTQALGVFDRIAKFEETHDEFYLYSALLQLTTGNGLKDIAEVFHYGAKKYAAWNWAKGMPWSVPMACIKRHLLAYLNNEELDSESGLPHLAHVGCNVIMLLHYAQHYKQGNDLPPISIFSGNSHAAL